MHKIKHVHFLGLPDFSRETHPNISKVCTHVKDYNVSLNRLQSVVSFAKQNATKVYLKKCLTFLETWWSRWSGEEKVEETSHDDFDE